MNLWIISPHRDDAAFSCGIAIRLALDAGASVVVLNVFTHSDYAPFSETSGVEGVSALRLAEDQAMLGLLEDYVDLRDLARDDAPIRRKITVEEILHQTDLVRFDAEAAVLSSDLGPLLVGADCVLVPLANQHLDHKVARAAAELCVSPERLVYYEDLPYFANLTEEDRKTTLQAFVPPSTCPVLLIHPDGSGIKRGLASCYPSQVSVETMEQIALYAKEREKQTGSASFISNGEVGSEMVYAGSKALAVLESVGAKTITL